MTQTLFGQDVDERAALLEQTDKALSHLVGMEDRDVIDARAGYLVVSGYRGLQPARCNTYWYEYGAMLARRHKQNTTPQLLMSAWTNEQLHREVRDNMPHARIAAEEAFRRWTLKQTA